MNRVLTLQQAARHIHIPERELFHLAQRGDVPVRKRGDEFFFEHGRIDEWAQRNILQLSDRELARRHGEAVGERIRASRDTALIPLLFAPDRISVSLSSRTRHGAIRDLVALAFDTGFLYDDAEFLQEVSDREDEASTAMPGGVAFLLAHRHDPYRASESFCLLGRAVHPVHFGASDGEPTDLFFLLCCIDDELHLHTLARLALLCRDEDLLGALREAADAAEMYDLLVSAEQRILTTLKPQSC